MTPTRCERHGIRWLAHVLARVLTIGPVLIAGPILLVYTANHVGNHVFFDFKGGLYNAGVSILHGHSPYWPHFLARQAAIMRAGGLALGETTHNAFSIPVYPALANVLVVPLALLPFWVASVLYSLIATGAMGLSLWWLEVRDWRCYALVLISWPFLFAAYLGAIGPFLVLGTAAAWRWRDRIVRPAVAIASIVAIKVFPWPLGVWLLITRRYRALAWTVAIGVALTFGAWAVIGFHGMLQYPQMLSQMSFIQQSRAVSIVAILLIAGVPASVATVVMVAVTVGVLYAAWRLAGGPDGDRRAFSLVILAALCGTPIVWEHYMVLLFVPIALVSPRLSAAWLIPTFTPLVMAISFVIPAGAQNVPFSPDTLRAAVPWMILEIATAVVILTTPAQRATFRARIRHRGSRPDATLAPDAVTA